MTLEASQHPFGELPIEGIGAELRQIESTLPNAAAEAVTPLGIDNASRIIPTIDLTETGASTSASTGMLSAIVIEGELIAPIIQPEAKLWGLATTERNSNELKLVDLGELTAAAIARWERIGASAADLEKLRSTELVVGDLVGDRLAETQGYRITLDIDAAGVGWYVDPQPWEDSEFAAEFESSIAGVDVFSAIDHEFGHILGIEHTEAFKLMSATLPIGERRLPTEGILALERSAGVISEPETLAAADLVITNTTIDPQATWGQNTQISWTVTNQGNLTASKDWYDNVWLSADGTIDGVNDTPLASYLIDTQTPLAPGGSYTKTVSINIPYIPSQSKIVVLTDTGHTSNGNFNDLQVESNEQNNSQVITTLTTPDLVITNTTIDPQATWGQSTQISWTVANQGSVNANKDWYDNIWLSADGTIDGVNDTPLASYLIDTQTPLAPGGSYTKTVSINIPYIPSQSKIVVLADTGHTSNGNFNNLQVESNEQNNSQVITTLISPDLVITGTTIDPQATWGQDTTISWTVTNQGSVNANKDWYDNIWLSADGTIDGVNDTPLASYLIDTQTPLAPGGSYTKTVSINIPYIPSQSKIVILTDIGHTSNGNFNNLQVESNEQNNSQVITTLTSPDLVITNTTIDPQATWGQSTQISWTVANQGSVNASKDWYDNVWLSADGTIDGVNDTPLASYLIDTQTPLAPGGSYTKTVSINIPYITSQSKIVVLTDIGHTSNGNFNNLQTEANEGNNSQVIATLTSPDLVIKEITIDSQSPWGKNAQISWIVTNQGSGYANRDWYDNVWLSADGVIDGVNDTYLGSYLIDTQTPLAPGSSYTKTVNINVPNDTTKKKIVVLTDIGHGSNSNLNNLQVESNDLNNTKIINLGNIQEDPVRADLLITNLTLPSSTTWGEIVPITWTVKNQGIEATNAKWTDYFYASDDAILDVNDLFIGYIDSPVNKLNPSETYSQSKNLTIPLSATGKKYLLAVTNRDRQQGETEFNNNVYALQAFGDGDLTIENAIAPAYAT